MSTNIALALIGICFLVTAVPFAVNTYQAIFGYNLPGSALAAAFGFLGLVLIAFCFVTVARQGLP